MTAAAPPDRAAACRPAPNGDAPRRPDLALPDSPLLRRRLPGLATALDADAMGHRLQDLLVGPDHEIVDCRPGTVRYRGPDGCDLRYALRLRHRSGGAVQPATVLGRVLPTAARAERYRRTRIDPLRAAVADRLGPFATAAAVAPELALVLSVFPLDPALPTLAAATDLRRLHRALPAVFTCPDGPVEVLRHARDGRCVLRYPFPDARPGPGNIYGKVYGDAAGDAQQHLLARLGPAVAAGLRVPRPLGYPVALRTLLCAQVPGRPVDLSDPGRRAAAVGAAARAAAVLHAAPVETALVHRTLGAELAVLCGELALIRPLWPEPAARLAAELAELTERADRIPAALPVFAHGDLTPGQLLLDAGGCGVVDFDAAAAAEPALDLGRFRGYLRLALARSGSPAGPGLAADFLAGYLDAARPARRDAAALAARVELYERLNLVRAAVRAGHHFKIGRLRAALSLL